VAKGGGKLNVPAGWEPYAVTPNTASSYNVFLRQCLAQ
jgi:hypothetical protein